MQDLGTDHYRKAEENLRRYPRRQFNAMELAAEVERHLEVIELEVEERRLVIAVDYGTTYTGVAFATPAGNRANLAEIDIVKDWGPGQGNFEKIPSVISYSLKTENREQQWGADLSSKAIAMVHTKLRLDVDNTSDELDLILQALDGMRNLDFNYIEDNAGVPKYPRKGPEKIVEDYLKKVCDYVLEAVANFSEELRARIPVDIVVTIPAEWGYRAKNSTFRALTRAGFNKENFPKLREMLMISEPEAAAIYTARFLKEQQGTNFLRKGECFVLCDAGGGTVDVVSYRVKQLEPTFEIESVTMPTGEKCGSIFINLAFKRWLKDLLGAEIYQVLDQTSMAYKISSHDAEGELMRELMKSFDVKKRQFQKGNRDIKIDLPAPYNNLNMGTRVVGGEITIPYETMKEKFFEPCANRIIELIQGQLEQIELIKKTRLKNVFLVGGFAESPYLQDSIRESLEMRDLELRRPDTSWTAVVRGACIFGIEKSKSTTFSSMSACSRSYGISVNMPFSNVDSNQKDLITDSLTQIPMAKDQLIWLIKKGDLILSDKPKSVSSTFSRNFTELGSKSGQIPIYSYDDEDLPGRLSNSQSELTMLHVIKYNLQDIPLQEFTRSKPATGPNGLLPPFYVAYLTITVTLTPPKLHLELKHVNRVLYTHDLVELPMKDPE